MRFRRAGIRDLLDIADIGRAAFPYIEHPLSFFLKRILFSHVVVLELEGKVVGFVDWEEKEGKAVIWGLAVKKAYRGLGLGRMLLSRILEEICQRVESVELMTLENNLVARKLYESSGFRIKKKEGRILWYALSCADR